MPHPTERFLTTACLNYRTASRQKANPHHSLLLMENVQRFFAHAKGENFITEKQTTGRMPKGQNIAVGAKEWIFVFSLHGLPGEKTKRREAMP
jgi:hypothetical protein